MALDKVAGRNLTGPWEPAETSAAENRTRDKRSEDRVRGFPGAAVFREVCGLVSWDRPGGFEEREFFWWASSGDERVQRQSRKVNAISPPICL